MICLKCIGNLGFARPEHKPTTCRCAICLGFSRSGYPLDHFLDSLPKRSIVSAIQTRLFAIKKKEVRLAPHVARHYRYVNEALSLKDLWASIDKKTTTVQPVRYEVQHDYSTVKDKTVKRKAEKLIESMTDEQKAALLEALTSGL